ncbi:MAG: amino acid ABC transporter substrate-binding protein [Candidatus Rokuibacteriota bacterium]
MRSRLAMSVVVLLAVAAGPAAGQEIRPTLDKIKETGAIQLGYRETSRPFSFRGSDGQPAGFSIDLCTQVAGALRESLKLPGLKVAWVPVTPADRIPKLVQGAIDLECGSTTITFGRMEQVAFSHMISVDGGSLLATVDSGIGTVKDLAGKRVGVIPNTTTEKALAAALAGASIRTTVVPVAEVGEGLRGLEEGRLDAYASDRLLLAGLLATARNPAKLRLSSEYFSYEPYALMMRRGDNPFQARVNRTLSTLYRSGLVQIYERWLGPFAAASPLMKALYLLHSWPD